MIKYDRRDVITAILTAVLIGSGIGPFVEANALNSMLWLYLYLFLVILMALFKVKWVIELPIQMIGLLFTCHRYFPSNRSFTVGWIQSFFKYMLQYTDPVQRTEFQFLPSPIALLFVGLFIIMLVKLIITYELWMMPFLALLSYLLILTIFNKKDLFFEIVWLLATGFILSIWIGRREGESIAFLKGQKLAIFSLVCCLLVAWQLPRRLPQLQESLEWHTQPLRTKLRTQPFYKMIEFARNNGESATTGFSENDSELGGSVTPNNETVFLAKQRQAHYWKVENKEIYSGRGWQSSPIVKEVLTQATVSIDEGHSSYQENERSIELILPNPIGYLPKPQGKIVWELPPAYRSNRAIEYSSKNNRIYINLSGNDASENIIQYDYFPPNYTLADLQTSQARAHFDNEEIYRQLPSTLPERVSVLARQITAESSNDYEKVKALESYLKNTGQFRYSMEQAESVPANRDYVDFFLFDSPVGYCEHFSSAMVVMARTLGMPARWAKGFSEGRVTSINGDGTKTYSVSNRDAHAWVEIYFEGIGWVPFEPTKSFLSSEQEVLTAQDKQEEEKTPTSSQETATSTTSKAKGSEAHSTSSSKPKKLEKKAAQKIVEPSRMKRVSQVLVVIIVSGVVAGGVMCRKQFRWAWWSLKVRIFPNYSFVKSYEGLFRLMEREIARSPSETLRQYQVRLLVEYPKIKGKLKPLTTKYEKLVYGNQAPHNISLSKKEQRTFMAIKKLVS